MWGDDDLKKSTLKVRSKAITVSKVLANDIREGRTLIIKPLLSKTVINSDDLFYLKEPLAENNTFTTKDTALTFIKVLSNKVVNIQSLTDTDIEHLNIEHNDIKTYYNNQLLDMVGVCVKNKDSINKLIKTYSYDSNPTIELIELEIITPDC